MKVLCALLLIVSICQSAVPVKKLERELAAGRFDLVIEGCNKLDGMAGSLEERAAVCRMAALAHLLRLEMFPAASRLVDAIALDPAFPGNVALLNEFEEILISRGLGAGIDDQMHRLEQAGSVSVELAREVTYARAFVQRMRGDFAGADSILLANPKLDHFWLGGAYSNIAGSGMSRLEDPERGIVDTTAVWFNQVGQPAGWRRVSDTTVEGTPVGVFLSFPEDACAVLLTHVESPVEQDARLHVSGAGRTRVWVNGREVLSMPEAQNNGDPLYVLPIRLTAGWNRILAKCCSEPANLWSRLQLTDKNGRSLDLQQNPDPFLWSGDSQPAEHPVAGLAAWDSTAWLPRWASGNAHLLPDEYFLGAFLFKRNFRAEGKAVLDRIVSAWPGSVVGGVLHAHELRMDELTGEADHHMLLLSANCPQLLEGKLAELGVRMEEKDLAATRTLVAELERNHGHTPEVMVMVGIQQMLDGDLKGGMTRLQDAVAHEPGNRELYSTLMGLQKATSDEAGRLETLGALANARPDLVEPARLLKDECLMRDQIQPALDWLQAVTRISGRKDLWYTGSAQILERSDRLDEALAAISQGLETRPLDLGSIETKANLLGKLGRDAEAQEVRREAARLHPHRPDILRKVRRLSGNGNPVDEIPGPSREELLSRDPGWLPEGTQAVYVFLKNENLVHDTGCSERRYHLLVKMLSQSAVKEFQTRTIVGDIELAQTVKSDGRVIPAEKRDDALAFADLQVGDMVEYRCLVDYAVIPGLPGECWLDWLLDASHPVLYSRFSVSYPERMKFTRVQHNIDLEPRTGHTAGREWQLFEAWQRPAVLREPGSGNHKDYSAWLDLSTVSDWGVIVDWYESVIAGRLEPVTELRELALSLGAGVTDDSTRIHRAAHFAKESLEYQGGQFVNNGHLPRPVRETLRVGYGDCKDQAVLLVGLLHEMGVQASVALVNSSRELTGSYLPSQRFTHAIVRAQGDDGRVWWIDPTDIHLAFPNVPSILEGQQALVISGDGTGFQRIPFDPIQERNTEARSEVVFSGDGDMTIAGRITYEGEEAAALRSFIAEGKPEKHESHVHSHVSPEDPGARLVDWSIMAHGLDSLAAISFEYVLPNGASRAGDLLVAPVPWGVNRVPKDLTTLEERQTALNVTGWRGCFRETMEFTLPEGASLLGEIAPVDLACSSGHYRLRGEITDAGKMRMTREFQLDTNLVLPEDYPDFRDMLRGAWKAENERIVVKMP
jgi:tetratricopeptide (TPR) repeat protein